jgi:hypothetical protein
MDFSTEAAEAKLRYQELLQEAAQERLARRVATQPAFETRLLRGLGETLITLGQSLKSMALSL